MLFVLYSPVALAGLQFVSQLSIKVRHVITHS